MTKLIAGSSLWLFGLVILGYHVSITDFPSILVGYSLAFCGYFLLSKHFNTENQFKVFLLLAFLGRLALTFSFPALSDDIYRFVWDGLLSNDGIDVLHGTPRALMDSGILEDNKYGQLFHQLNSPDYYTVYPPIIQGINHLIVSVTEGDIWLHISALRLLHLLADTTTVIISIKICQHLKITEGCILWLMLNPLFVVEGFGNLHFEGIAICFLAGFSYLLVAKKSLVSSIPYAAAVLVKLNPLLLLPLIFRANRVRAFIQFILLTVVLAIVGFLTAHSIYKLSGLATSIQLYFQTFEFNASFYYLIRGGIQWLIGYNPIQWVGPLCSAMSLIAIVWLSVTRPFDNNKSAIFFTAAAAYTFYLLGATTVHPWYVLIPLFFSIFTPARWLIFWSYLVVLSYSHYWEGLYEERYGWLFFEYASLAFLYWYLDRPNWRKVKIREEKKPL
jgi:alpha-1,6-mannosyltransferase